MSVTPIAIACHFCNRREDDLIGRLKALPADGTHAGAHACDVPDRDDCVRIAYNRLRRKGRR